jgi:prophage regulatory protein
MLLRPRIVRRPEVQGLTGLSASTIERLEKAGDFPRRRRLGPSAVGWIFSEIEDWIASRPHADGRAPSADRAPAIDGAPGA